jgi:hypothetical protein
MCQSDRLPRRAVLILLIAVAAAMAVPKSAPAAQESSIGSVASSDAQAVSFSEEYLADQLSP